MEKNIKDEIEKAARRIRGEGRKPLRIAVFGQPGAGKSSLINALLGQDVAKVGAEADVTTEARGYAFTNSDSEFTLESGMELWDLPGYGTSKFPAGAFIEKFDVRSFDLFICAVSGKFTDDDDKLLQDVVESGRPYVLASTKFDTRWQPGLTPDEIKQVIRKDFAKHLRTDAGRLVLVSVKDGTGLEELNAAISSLLDEALRAKFAFAAKAYSLEALERKREAAKAVVTEHALLAAANGINPIPGADVAIDVGLLVRCFSSIRDAYGLSDAVIKDPNLVQVVPVANRLLQYLAKDGVIAILKRFAGRQAAKQGAKYIPLVGPVIAASTGFVIAKLAGNAFVDECHEVAEAIFKSELQGTPLLRVVGS